MEGKCKTELDLRRGADLTRGEIVWLEYWVIQRVGALQLHPANTGASHWSNVNLKHQSIIGSANVLLSHMHD